MKQKSNTYINDHSEMCSLSIIYSCYMLDLICYFMLWVIFLPPSFGNLVYRINNLDDSFVLIDQCFHKYF